MRKYQEPPTAPQDPPQGPPGAGCGWAHRLKPHQQLMPLPATLSLSLCLERAQLSRKGEDREKDWRGTASLLRVLGTEPAPSHRSEPLGDDGDDVLGGEPSPASKGRQAKASREEPAPARPGTGYKGNPSRPRAHKCHHQVGIRESPGKVISHFGPCHTSGAGREGGDSHRAWPQHLPSRSFPSPLREGDQHKPEQPPAVRKGVKSSRLFRHQHFQAGMRQPLTADADTRGSNESATWISSSLKRAHVQ